MFQIMSLGGSHAIFLLDGKVGKMADPKRDNI